MLGVHKVDYCWEEASRACVSGPPMVPAGFRLNSSPPLVGGTAEVHRYLVKPHVQMAYYFYIALRCGKI